MGKLAERLKASRSLSYRQFEVSEWGEDDQPLVVYCTPITLSDLSKIKARSDGDDAANLAYTVILKALDAQGDHLFGLEDKPFLMGEESSNVVSKVVLELNKVTGFEALKKS
ncbi:MAG: hypothetical protein R8M45_03025 [Ghiorsea sp.]